MDKRAYIYISLCAVLVIISALDCHAQRYPERRLIRQGNKDYEKGEWLDSEIDYRRALEKTPDSYEAQFNLGNSLYKQDRFDEAEQIFLKLGQDSTSSGVSSKSHYNAGNALFQQRKLEEALEEYKEALRKNPNDTEAKFNLAYVKKLLEKDQDDNDDGNDDNDQNQDNDQDQNQDQNNDDNDNNDNSDNDKDDNGDGDDDQNNDGDGQSPPEQQPQPSGMTREEAERMLEAIQMNEDQTREKIDEEKGKVVIQSEKNW